MSTENEYAPLRGPISSFTWPLELIPNRHDWNYDWDYLGNADKDFCTWLAVFAGIVHITFWFAFFHIFVAPETWKEFAGLVFALVAFYALLTWARFRLHSAARRAASTGQANLTNEAAQILKDAIEFVSFYWNTSVVVVGSIGFIVQMVIAGSLIYTWIVAGLSLFSICLLVILVILHLFFFELHRNPKRWKLDKVG